MGETEEAKVSSKTAKEVIPSPVFNLNGYLSNLKKSLETTLFYYDKILYKEYKKIEITRRTKNSSSQDLTVGYDSNTNNLSESLSNIRKSISRKRNLLDDDIDCRSQIVGRQWSESLKYSRVESRKTLREIRIAAELRDVIFNAIDGIIQSLSLEMVKPSTRYISTNEMLYSARRVVDFEYFSNPFGERGRSSTQSMLNATSRYNKKRSVDSLLNSSVNKISAYNNSSISLSDKKKAKNLNGFILKKNSEGNNN